MAFFIMEYRVEGYSLADCMRPDPRWGKKIFTVDGNDIGTHDIEVVKQMAAAPENTPAGYVLFSVRDRDGQKGVE